MRAFPDGFEKKLADNFAKRIEVKVRVFRQRVSQVHESETEINDWLEEVEGTIDIKFVEQSAYLTDNTENAQPGHIVSVWYNEN